MIDELERYIDGLIDSFSREEKAADQNADATCKLAAVQGQLAAQTVLLNAQFVQLTAQSALLNVQQKALTAGHAAATTAALQLTTAHGAAAAAAQQLTAAQQRQARAVAAPGQPGGTVALGQQFGALAQGVGAFQRQLSASAGFFTAIAARANPLAWEVLQDSVGLVAMELGRAFLPAIVTGAAYAQQFAAWLATLSPATMQTITTIATLGGALYGTAKIFSLVNIASFGLAGALGKAAAAALLQAAVTNPLGAAITAAVAGLAALAWWSSRNADNARRGVAEVREGVLQNLGIADIEESELGKKVQGAGAKEEKQKILRDNAGQIHDELVEAEAKFRGAKDEDKEPARKRLEAAAKQAEIFDALNRQVNLGQTFVPHQGAGPAGFEGAAGRRASEIGMLLTRIPKEVQPRFSAIDEARRQAQIGALKSPLEQEQMRLNRQAAQDFLKLVPVLMKRLQEGKSLYGLG